MYDPSYKADESVEPSKSNQDQNEDPSHDIPG